MGVLGFHLNEVDDRMLDISLQVRIQPHWHNLASNDDPLTDLGPSPSLQLFVPGQVLWAVANSCVKCSILSLYTRLFPRKQFCRICYAMMVLAWAYFVIVMVATFALCHPIQYNWNKKIPGSCHGEVHAYLSTGITNLVIDAFIVTLPIPTLLGLRMSLSKKLGLIAMFSLGSV